MRHVGNCHGRLGHVCRHDNLPQPFGCGRKAAALRLSAEAAVEWQCEGALTERLVGSACRTEALNLARPTEEDEHGTVRLGTRLERDLNEKAFKESIVNHLTGGMMATAAAAAAAAAAMWWRMPKARHRTARQRLSEEFVDMLEIELADGECTSGDAYDGASNVPLPEGSVKGG